MTCRTPGCATRGSRGLFGNFCAPCARNLARIREAFEAETLRWEGNHAGRKRNRPPVCCTVGCSEPRPAGEAYCAVCRAIGVDEEAA